MFSHHTHHSITERELNNTKAKKVFLEQNMCKYTENICHAMKPQRSCRLTVVYDLCSSTQLRSMLGSNLSNQAK